MDTGMANTGIIVERQFCKKRNTTKADQGQSLQQGLHHFLHRNFYNRHRFKGHGIIHIGRK